MLSRATWPDCGCCCAETRSNARQTHILNRSNDLLSVVKSGTSPSSRSSTSSSAVMYSSRFSVSRKLWPSSRRKQWMTTCFQRANPPLAGSPACFPNACLARCRHFSMKSRISISIGQDRIPRLHPSKPVISADKIAIQRSTL